MAVMGLTVAEWQQVLFKLSCSTGSVLFCLYLGYRALRARARRCDPLALPDDDKPIGEASFGDGPPRFNG